MSPIRVLALCLVVFAACGPDEGNEARLLLDRLDGLNTPDLAQRRQRVDALRHMPLSAERAVELRDACVPMHAAMLEADEAHALARAAVDALEQGGDDGAGERAAHAIARSENAVMRVRDLQQNCQDLLANYRARFGVAAP